VVPYYPSGQTPLTKDRLFRVERALPKPGWTMVAVGDHVSPGEDLARATVASSATAVDVAARLDIPGEKASATLVRTVGSRLHKGEVFAETKGMFRKRSVQSPIDGVFTSFDSRTGFAFISPEAQEVVLASSLPGTVVDLSDSQKVTLELSGTRLFGIIGFGPERTGTLRMVGYSGEITADMISEDCEGAILLGRDGIAADALLRAATLGAAGVVTGSITLGALQSFTGLRAEQVFLMNQRDWEPSTAGPSPLTIVVTEGIGRISMPLKKFEILSAMAGNNVVIYGRTKLRGGLTRPEIILPQGEAVEEEEAGQEVPEEPTVWINCPPYSGVQGRALEVLDVPQKLENGIYARPARVAIGERITLVPVQDIEIGESA
jgi:hypothetical protein